jgi:hypothetical protein
MDRAKPRRTDRKRSQTDFLGATEAPRSQTKQSQLSARRAREAAIDSAYEPICALKQLGEVEGGEGSVWVGANGSPALNGFAPTPDDRQRFLDLVQQYRAANPASHSATMEMTKPRRSDRGRSHLPIVLVRKP